MAAPTADCDATAALALATVDPEAVDAVEVPEVAALAVELVVVELVPVARAAAWKASKLFAAVGLTANTIPSFAQWLCDEGQSWYESYGEYHVPNLSAIEPEGLSSE